MRSGHDRQLGGEPPVAEPRIPVETEYLDLDHDGVPDAVQITEILEYDTGGGADVVEEIRELDAGIGPDGVPTTVTVTDIVQAVAVHPALEPPADD